MLMAEVQAGVPVSKQLAFVFTYMEAITYHVLF